MKRAVIAGAAFVAWFMAAQFARASERLSVAAVRALVNQVNTEFGNWFEVADVMAIIEIESSFDPDAYRYESHLDDASIGLMQILYQTAQDRGLTGGPASLFDPVTNIRMGMRQLKWTKDYLEGRGITGKSEWIAAYNAGVGNIARNGIINPAYVTKFNRARAAYDGT